MERETSVGTSQRGEVEEPAPRTWSDDEDRALRLWTALARCYASFSGAMASEVARHDLTVPQFGVLETLHHLGSMPLGDLAEKLLVTGGNITYVMDRLEERGLVYRERSSEDRRVVFAHLSSDGREMMAEVFPEHAAFVREVVDELEPGEQDELRDLLKQLGKSIRADEET